MENDYQWSRNKTLLRQIMLELRELWNRFDPIGVVDDWQVDDEYDSYRAGTLKALQSELPRQALQSQLLAALDYMGLGLDNVSQSEIDSFINDLIEWFDTVKERAKIDQP